jgi:hypothetical protein
LVFIFWIWLWILWFGIDCCDLVLALCDSASTSVIHICVLLIWRGV